MLIQHSFKIIPPSGTEAVKWSPKVRGRFRIDQISFKPGPFPVSYIHFHIFIWREITLTGCLKTAQGMKLLDVVHSWTRHSGAEDIFMELKNHANEQVLETMVCVFNSIESGNLIKN